MSNSLKSNGLAALACCLGLTVAALFADDEPARFDFADAQTHAIRMVDPVYPKNALSSKVESTVAIDDYVEADGSVSSTIIVFGDLKLVDAAEEAAKQWKFKPFETNGKPARVIVRLLFHMKPPVGPKTGR
ncbi:MAG: energy transducer TonB [Acidobacteriia bacterium]|nr:energy transducer TonB [Terriglobia bacterium]